MYTSTLFRWYISLLVFCNLQASTQAVTLVPCDSSETGTYVYDSQTGHLVLQREDSLPPSDFPPTNPDAMNSSTPAGNTDSITVVVVVGGGGAMVVIFANASK